jgi:hypothetical protein
MKYSIFRMSKIISTSLTIFFLLVVNIFICTSTAGMLFIKLLSSGVNRFDALVLAGLMAVIMYLYIIYNHKIRQFINNKELENK